MRCAWVTSGICRRQKRNNRNRTSSETGHLVHGLSQAPCWPYAFENFDLLSGRRVCLAFRSLPVAVLVLLGASCLKLDAKLNSRFGTLRRRRLSMPVLFFAFLLRAFYRRHRWCWTILLHFPFGSLHWCWHLDRFLLRLDARTATRRRVATPEPRKVSFWRNIPYPVSNHWWLRKVLYDLKRPIMYVTNDLSLLCRLQYLYYLYRKARILVYNCHSWTRTEESSPCLRCLGRRPLLMIFKNSWYQARSAPGKIVLNGNWFFLIHEK